VDDITRREFIRRLLVWGLGASGAGTLLAGSSCGGDPTVAPTATPAQPPTAAALRPTSTLVTRPSPTRPAASPTAQLETTVEPTMAAPTATPLAISTPTPPPAPGDAYLAVARGDSPEAIVHASLRALGGIERFVKPGDDVIIKPNICVAYHSPEYAATTNPQVVAALVGFSLGAGAKRVRVMDQPFGGTPAQAYSRSGIGEAVQAAGGQMEIMAKMKYQVSPIPEGRDIGEWSVYQDVLKADVVISVPIAKNHGLATLTLGMKNLMGVIENRGGLHINLGQRIADLTSLVRPTLTVVDAVRILMDHGPTGGSLDDVKLMNTVIASHDIVAADAYAATLFGLTAANVPATVAGAEMGLGTMEWSSVKVEEIRL